MQPNETIQNQIEATFKDINQQFESSTITTQNCIDEISQQNQIILGLNKLPDSLFKDLPKLPNIELSAQFSLLQSDIVEVIKNNAHLLEKAINK
ncbi:unnamed protein product [Paramecium sonneborni]|uniref:Uncharacterized protein n=1 Tax=Paramecium sonneborni TaxID=65129 RepID=A0A8S1NSF4_9CILI|nr:unnamed protein product [Paramecium sonneborni]